MSSPSHSPTESTLDLAKYRRLPDYCIGIGGVVALIGAVIQPQQFGFSWLQAFMFFLSFGLGALFLVILHHLFDAMWSVPIRRFVEHIAFLLPILFLLFIPILVLAPVIYPWMNPQNADHALHAKEGYLNKGFWYFRAFFVFGIWTWLSYSLRKWSLRQDQTGSAECTVMLRRYAAGGIFLFAITLTLAAIDWVKSLEHQWFSTMYGVYYFAESVWVSLATFYIIALVLKKTGSLQHVARERQFHDLGVLMFAFTVFYAYINFSQYFLIWNAALPEETFWYVKREVGTWWSVGMIIVFGHFVLPFLALLRIDAKLSLTVMVPLCIWAWVCHFFDLAYNIMPVLHPPGWKFHVLDYACLAVIGGVLVKVFIKYYTSHPPYPQRDPRMAEAMEVYVAPISAGQAAKAHGAAK